MAIYGGYTDGAGITKRLRKFSTTINASAVRTESEDVEDSRLGIGYGYVGHVDGMFVKINEKRQ